MCVLASSTRYVLSTYPFSISERLEERHDRLLSLFRFTARSSQVEGSRPNCKICDAICAYVRSSAQLELALELRPALHVVSQATPSNHCERVWLARLLYSGLLRLRSIGSGSGGRRARGVTTITNFLHTPQTQSGTRCMQWGVTVACLTPACHSSSRCLEGKQLSAADLFL